MRSEKLAERKQRELITKQHLNKPPKALESSSICINKSFTSRLISKACYATYHVAYAMLYQFGFSPGAQKGLQNLFFTQVIQTDLLEKEMNKILARLSEERSTADYGPLPVIDEENSAEAIKMASAFVERIRQLLEEREER